MISSFLMGVGTSLLATFLAWLFYRLWKSRIVPWYQRILYRGILVDGAWKGARKDGDTVYGFTIHLEQNGHEVGGTFMAENQRDTTTTTKSFDLIGEISNSCILLRYSPSDHHTYGTGAFLFQVFDAGRLLKGGMLYFRTRSGQIGAVDDIQLERTK